MTKQTTESAGSITNLLLSLVLLSSLGVLLFGLRVIASDSIRYWFLLWNLVLSWLPLIFALMLHRQLQRLAWFSWKPLLLAALWLSFMPNSFYLISDLVHLHESGDVSLLYDVVMFTALICAGVINGVTGIMVVHYNLLKRLSTAKAHVVITVVLFLVSFAIYLGRSLRWNTWDIFINPAGILFDLSEHVINPSASGGLIMTTLLFFALISALYLVAWNAIRYVRSFK